MAYINSIQIPPQESAEALAQAAASALATALGWTADGTSVWQDEDKSGLRFVFDHNASYVFPGVGNSLTKQANNSLTYNPNTYYFLDYYDTGNTVAIGLRTASGIICLSAVIAKNTSGKFKALSLYSTSFSPAAQVLTKLQEPLLKRIQAIRRYTLLRRKRRRGTE